MSDRTIFEYVEAMATPNPAPGAGSAAATAAAMGCALGEMVCNITLKSTTADVSDKLLVANRDLSSCRARLLALGPADEAAYMGFRDAQAMPKLSAEAKSARTAAMQSTLLVAADVPLEIAAMAGKALTALVEVAAHGSRYTLADIATAGYLLDAALLGASENVQVNIGLIKDPAQQKRLSRALQALESARERDRAQVMAHIADRST